jgi:hypothetical protein
LSYPAAFARNGKFRGRRRRSGDNGDCGDDGGIVVGKSFDIASPEPVTGAKSSK